METGKQAAYRAYLSTDHWKNKRLSVLEQRGCKCEKCGEWGNEIHHLTYENLWNEPLTDLQVLCGDCHEATHRALKCAKISQGLKNKKNKRVKISRGAIASSLSEKQINLLSSGFKTNKFIPLEVKKSNVILAIIKYSNDPDDRVLINKAARLLGFSGFYPKIIKQANRSQRIDPFKNKPARKPMRLM